VLYAISQDLDIGIDVEWCNPQLQHRDIARRICTPSEWLYFSALSAAQQQANFFRIWTRKEALIKLFGDRLFDELQSYEVATPTIFRGWVNAQNQRVWLQDLELFDDFAAAIAVLQPPHHIFTNHWEWQA
jgi:4'-phosphopantetheinyl transferase